MTNLRNMRNYEKKLEQNKKYKSMNYETFKKSEKYGKKLEDRINAPGVYTIYAYIHIPYRICHLCYIYFRIYAYLYAWMI